MKLSRLQRKKTNAKKKRKPNCDRSILTAPETKNVSQSLANVLSNRCADDQAGREESSPGSLVPMTSTVLGRGGDARPDRSPTTIPFSDEIHKTLLR